MINHVFGLAITKIKRSEVRIKHTRTLALLLRNMTLKMYQTRLSTKSNSVEYQKDPPHEVEDDLRILLIRLEKDLRENVFPKSVVELVKKVRFVTDLKKLIKRIKTKTLGCCWIY